MMASSTVAAGDNATTNFYISLHLWAQFQTATAPTPWLYGPEAVLSTITLAGLVLNGAVIYVTVRDESLRGTCNFLLATTSGCEILHQISHLASLYVATLGGNFIDFGTCVRLQAVPLFGLFAVQGSILATAVDRLVASLFPVFYKTGQEKWRMKCVLMTLYGLGISGLALPFCLLMYFRGQEYAFVMTLCDTGELFGLYSNANYVLVVPNLVCCFIYLAVWLAVRKKVQAQNSQSRIFRSLVAIVCVNVCGYLVNFGLMNFYIIVLGPFINTYQFWMLYQFNAVLLNTCAAANAPILHWMSSDYRKAFDRHILRRAAVGVGATWAVHAGGALNTHSPSAVDATSMFPNNLNTAFRQPPHNQH